MRGMARLRMLAIILAGVGMLIPAPALAGSVPGKAVAKTPSQVPVTADVQLLKNGALVGQTVNAQGVPLSGVPVLLMRHNRTLAQTKSNREGHFALTRVAPGAYQIVAGDSQKLCRLWAAKTAPPKAARGALMVVGNQTMRAQSPANGPLAYYLGNPWIIGGIVAAAVAIPVAIHNHQIDNEDNTPTSP